MGCLVWGGCCWCSWWKPTFLNFLPWPLPVAIIIFHCHVISEFWETFSNKSFKQRFAALQCPQTTNKQLHQSCRPKWSWLSSRTYDLYAKVLRFNLRHFQLKGSSSRLWERPPPQTLESYRQILIAQWPDLVWQCPCDFRMKLKYMIGIKTHLE